MDSGRIPDFRDLIRSYTLGEPNGLKAEFDYLFQLIGIEATVGRLLALLVEDLVNELRDGGNEGNDSRVGRILDKMK